MPGNIPLPSPSVVKSWPAPNYVDPVRRAWLPPYALVLQSLTSFVVILRLALRCTKHGGGIGLDDALLIPSWLLSIAFTIVAVVASNEGLVDRHIWDVRATRYPDMALSAWISELFFLLGTLCIKVSVLLFYQRLVRGGVSRNWRLAIWAAIGFTIAWTLGVVLALILNCEPTRAYWKAYDLAWTHKYHCTDTKWINPLTGILCMVSDIYAVALPWLLLRPIQMARRQKLQLNLLFGLGLVVAAVSAGPDLHQPLEQMVRFGNDYDLTWIGFDVYVFSLLEYELGISVACLPALRALLKHMAQRADLQALIEGSSTRGTTIESSDELESESSVRARTFEEKNRNIIGGYAKT